MNAQANRLSVISDNISNSGTNGYKRSEAEFSSLVLSSPGAGDYNSGTVKTQVRQTVSEQGSIASTSSSTDAAISGDGFFVVQDQSGREFYTRAGSFVRRTETGANGSTTYLVNSAGYRLTGTDAKTGVTGPVELPVGEIVAPTPTTGAKLDLQFPVTANVGDQKTTSIQVYDAVGTAKTLTMTMTKTAANQWSLDLSDGTTTTSSTVTFDGTNGLPTTTGNPGTMNITLGTGNTVAVDFGSLTEYNSDFSAKVSKDGNPAGYFQSFSIADTGDSTGIIGVMADGSTVQLYKLNLARFNSPDQLQAGPGNVYSATLQSGNVEYGVPGSNGFGSVVSNAVENSNVDLASELTNMIESQRSYSANSKVFQTGSEILDVLINLKR
ncbi:flagellar hook protein FlgE [Jiella sp. MQZ9-1]|uniref:Flagellar hook protein FlgE n=2 Tax=Jiella flava TaxID=2816857 RepID=A0A939FWB2_9HYPH|nr:flagellar hook protein FlgE [Jiella flava]MCD2469888.1 flagellar hook protein FlgE [Jiella flava]